MHIGAKFKQLCIIYKMILKSNVLVVYKILLAICLKHCSASEC